MAWNEIVNQRNQRSCTYQDTGDSNKKAWSGTLAALHYESVLDSGVYDAEIDMASARMDNPQFDGWRVTANSWHYALGKDLASHGDQDGWVGFGGRQGAHWFKFRLQRAGYLHWPTREWQDIGGAPSYNRAFLSQETGTLTIGPNDDPINVGSVATWSDIWKTPGGGSLSVSWRPDGYRLKEEITVNQSAREWIAANRPPETPLDETYFGFVFELDWSDIPKIVRAGVQVSPDDDFVVDGESIELKDVLDRLLAFMPLSDVRVPTVTEENDPIYANLRKRFYSEGGKHYLLVGVRCDTLNSMPAGDLIFDPTVDEQVGASLDDAREKGDGTFQPAYIYLSMKRYASSSSSSYRCAGARWQTVNVPQGATISTAYQEIYVFGSDDDPHGKIYANDVDDAVNFDTVGNGGIPKIISETDRPRTTAYAHWEAIAVGIGWKGSTLEIKTVIQEITDRPGWSANNDLVLLYIADIGTTKNFTVYGYDQDSSYGPKLHIEYSAAAAIPRHPAVIFQGPAIM